MLKGYTLCPDKVNRASKKDFKIFYNVKNTEEKREDTYLYTIK